MSEERKAAPVTRVREGQVSLARIVDSLGTSAFEAQLLEFLNQASGADHCVVYRFGDGEMRVLGAASLNGTDLARTNALRYAREGFWQRDPVVIDAERSPPAEGSKLVRVEPQQISDPELREHFYLRPQMREKVFISGERDGYLYGVSIFRTNEAGRFSEEDLHRLAQSADFLISCFAKHAGIALDRKSAAAEFASVEPHRAAATRLAAAAQRAGGAGVRAHSLRTVERGHRARPRHQARKRDDVPQAGLSAHRHRDPPRALLRVPALHLIWSEPAPAGEARLYDPDPDFSA